jgi:hypothetical protein
MRQLATALLGLVLATGAQAQSLSWATFAQAQTAKEKYDLQTQCARQAAEVFKKESNSEAVNYEDHYNSRLNKCFYIEITNGYDEHLKAPVKDMMLNDLNENRVLASYHKWGNTVELCVVEQKQCKTEEGWLALIKPFMED